jgi:hypothetical protein
MIFYPFLLKLHGSPFLPRILLRVKFKSILTKFCRATLLVACFSDFEPELLLVLEGVPWSFL